VGRCRWIDLWVLINGEYERALAALNRSAAGEWSRPPQPTADYCLRPGFRVRWEGETDLQPLLWRALEHLLSQQDYPLPVDRLEDALWHGQAITSKTLANTLSRLNTALLPIKFTWTWRVRSGFVYRDG
jgi:hypothetical protein